MYFFWYFRIFSASYLITFLSPEIATSINVHVPFSLSRIMMSGLLLGTVLSVCTCWFHNMVTLPSWLVSTDFGTCSYQCFLSNCTPVSLHFKCVVLSQSSRCDICDSQCYIPEHWNIGSSFYSQTLPDVTGLDTRRRDELWCGPLLSLWREEKWWFSGSEVTDLVVLNGKSNSEILISFHMRWSRRLFLNWGRANSCIVLSQVYCLLHLFYQFYVSHAVVCVYIYIYIYTVINVNNQYLRQTQLMYFSFKHYTIR